MGQDQRAFKVKKIKIFDPAEGFSPFTNVVELTDASIAKRGDRWWMCLAGEPAVIKALNYLAPHCLRAHHSPQLVGS